MITTFIGLCQPLNAIFWPHPPEEGEKKISFRLIWEIFHKDLGYIGIILAVITIGMGTTLLPKKDDQRIFQICYGGIVGTLVFLLQYLLLAEKRKRYPV